MTGEAYDWWFGWHTVETAPSKLWNPVAHQYAYGFPETLDWTNATLNERYIGMTSLIDEYVGNWASKLSIQFIDPASIGFDTNAFADQSVETIVVGRIRIGGTHH